MKKLLLILSFLCFSILVAQTNRQTVIAGFDEAKALQEAKAKGLAPVDYAGYVKHQYNHWLQQNGSLPIKTKSAVAKKTPNSVLAGTNMDFETGNYGGWNIFAGENTVNSNGPLANLHPALNCGVDSLPTLCNMTDTSLRNGLMTNLYNDPICGVSLSSPMGGNYVARLNRLCTSYEAAMLTQTFQVTVGQTILNYAYAVVLEDGGHAFGEQTYFKVLVKDQSNAIIDSVYMQAANGVTPGFYPVTNGNGYTYYKPWTPVSVNLVAYLGQNVTVEVTASDCIYGGHSGYAYFDARLDSTASTPNVWPGDANYDLTADMNDLLYLGWAYGATGVVRTGATNTWQAEPCANWGQSTIYGTEYKHADCNGDGTIDDNDTTAILQNYGQLHAFKMANPNQVSAMSAYRNLIITPNVSTVGPNQTLALNISVPTNTASVSNNLYGIAFRLSAPASYIATLASSDFSASFLGTKGSTMMTLVKTAISQDHIDLCLVRKDHQNSAAGGTLIDLNLTTTNFSMNGTHNFSISAIKAVDFQGAYLPIGAGTALVNFNTASGIQKVNTAELHIVPNPANDKIYVDGLTEKTTFEIINVIGQPVLKATLDAKKFIDVSAFEKGAYFIKLSTPQGVVIKKFIKD